MSTLELDFLDHLEHELRDLTQRDAHPRRHPRLIIAATCAVAGLAVLLALTLNLDDAGRPGSHLGGSAAANAAIARARAALTPPTKAVFHVRIESREQGRPPRVNEIWQSTTSLRTTNPGRPEAGARKDGTQELYDRVRNTIYAARVSRVAPSSLLAAYTSDARKLLNSGARVAGNATVDGIDCLRIEDSSVHGITHTLFVDARTYRPVLERTTGATTRSELHFRSWQVFTPTPAARRLADLRSAHPHARVVLSKQAYYAAEVRLLHLLPGAPGQPPRPRPIRP